MNKKPKTKTKVFQMRVTDEFINTVEELGEAFGMNKTEVIEFAIELFPALARQKGGSHEKE